MRERANGIEHVYDEHMSQVDATPRDLDPEVAVAAGALNLAHAALTRLAAEAIATGSWAGTSPKQWLTYRAGVTSSRAQTIIDVAEQRDRFPAITARFDAGELSLEQVNELVKAPPEADADIEHWGTLATPSRIRRSIRRRYGRPEPADCGDRATDAGDAGEDVSCERCAERDWVGSGVTDDHRWRIRGEFDLETGSMIEAAMLAAREALWARGQRTISAADCFREVMQRYCDGIDAPLRRDRAKVWIHLDAADGTAVTLSLIHISEPTRPTT